MIIAGKSSACTSSVLGVHMAYIVVYKHKVLNINTTGYPKGEF
jgi:hypothetical protein